MFRRKGRNVHFTCGDMWNAPLATLPGAQTNAPLTTEAPVVGGTTGPTAANASGWNLSELGRIIINQVTDYSNTSNASNTSGGKGKSSFLSISSRAGETEPTTETPTTAEDASDTHDADADAGVNSGAIDRKPVDKDNEDKKPGVPGGANAKAGGMVKDWMKPGKDNCGPLNDNCLICDYDHTLVQDML